MGNNQLLTYPNCNLATRNIISFNNAIHSDKEEIRGKGVALSQAPRAWEEASWGAVDENRERSCGNAPFYPAHPPTVETHPAHDLVQELPTYTIVCFFYIQLTDHPHFFLLRVESTISLRSTLRPKSIAPLRKHFETWISPCP